MAFYNVRGDPTTTHEDAIALLWHCKRLLRVPWHFTLFKDAAKSPSGVTGVLMSAVISSLFTYENS